MLIDKISNASNFLHILTFYFQAILFMLLGWIGERACLATLFLNSIFAINLP